ncbi:hypothetical protein ASG52_20690 [Methylobacterium sp. Leaf456]|uniref:2-keto-4-pentenoate hydratase n=1 Tax=Methylobacterium sp. Leaf456 TaxID=1736382 RepID=UPI0006F2F02F|nr:fumarylacetoacetate hydrolase family protein [Methylobacterium sp. Leaf456]KQT59795.1 hypothetical protein ASG52_20690 [Methylobacterium sp. Leaf456]
MALSTFAPDDAADVLLNAYRAHRLLEELPEEIRPVTLAEGYDVQDRLVAKLGQVVGWKLGAGSPRARRETGLGLPIAGRILADRMFDAGQPVELAPVGPVIVEFEIAYVLGRAIGPNDQIEDPLSAVATVHTAFELVRSRFRDRQRAGWPSFAADNAAFEAFVLGPQIPVADQAPLEPTLEVRVDGVSVAAASTGADRISAETAFADFITLAQSRGMPLPAGSIISTGTQSVPFQIDQSAQIVASWLDASLTLSLRFRA